MSSRSIPTISGAESYAATASLSPVPSVRSVTPPARIPAPRIAEALEAFLRSKPRALELLVRATKRTGSPVVARRLGYLVELIAGEQAAAPLHRLIGVSRKADALDAGDEKAPIVSRWQIRTRLGPEELLEHRRVS